MTSDGAVVITMPQVSCAIPREKSGNKNIQTSWPKQSVPRIAPEHGLIKENSSNHSNLGDLEATSSPQASSAAVGVTRLVPPNLPHLLQVQD